MGGPKSGRTLSLAAGAPIKYPNGKRVQGRTLAQALHHNAYLEDMEPRFKIGQNAVSADRIGRQPNPVARPARSRRPR